MPSAAYAGRGTQLQRGNGASPEVFTTIAELKKVTRAGSKADLADVTNMDSPTAYREKLPTLVDPGEVNFEGNYVPNDGSQQTAFTDFGSQAKHNWQIVLPNSLGTWSFAGYITAYDVPDSQVDKEVTFSGKLTITGAPTFASGTGPSGE
jgi:predicted secreted protein